ncbi:MAG: hypothetical protein AB7F86_17665 [Bdellovibrionales bacterium]
MNRNDDEQFMARFANRLSLEPNPEWARTPRWKTPWQELGWALAAALLLNLYWKELRIGALTIQYWMANWFGGVPSASAYMMVAALLIFAGWAWPRFSREL